MNRTRLLATLAAIALLALGVFAGSWWAHRSMTVAQPAASADAGRKVLYWHDPMYPQQRFDKPGKSPFMDMPLVPVYADDAAPAAGAQVSAQLAQNLGVRTVAAERGRLARDFQAVGTVAFDERAVSMVQARSAGYIEKLTVRAPLDPVHKGQELAVLFVPEWAGAQQEYLALKEKAPDLAGGARSRLLLLGMTEEQVASVDREGRPLSRFALFSPADGVIGELNVREGMTVTPGMTLFRVNGLATVWVNVEVPEAQAGEIRPGTPISASVPAYPGVRFPGTVAAVLPEVNAATRTLRARAELANPGLRLKPGMFATVAIAPRENREAVLVPSEALIVTGERKVVVVDRGNGRFEPVEVETGREDGARTEILKGIEPGVRVVASGQFLLDSEASLRGLERRMSPEGAAPGSPVQAHRAEGRLEKASGTQLTISHGPVPSIGWGAMTMDFKAPAAGLPAGIKAGDPVAFEFMQSPDGSFAVTRIEPRAGAKP